MSNPNHTDDITHSVCNKHNIGVKSVCCACSGKTDCNKYRTSFGQNVLSKLEPSNHTKDKLTPDLVSIDDTKPTRNEQSEVRGIVEEMLEIGWNPKLKKHNGTSVVVAFTKEEFCELLQHLQENHEAEKRELVDSIEKRICELSDTNNASYGVLKLKKDAVVTDVHSMVKYNVALELYSILKEATHHGLSTKE